MLFFITILNHFLSRNIKKRLLFFLLILLALFKFFFEYFFYFTFQVVNFTCLLGLRDSHFVLQHQTMNLRLSEKEHHRVLENVQLFEKVFYVELAHHFLLRFVEVFHHAPLFTLHFHDLQQVINCLQEIVTNVELLGRCWTVFLYFVH